MKILVTGAYGQLGRVLNELSGKFPFWQFVFTDLDVFDVTDEIVVQDFFRKNSPNFVINCAAYTAVDKAETDVANARNVNALAPGYLAKSARIAGAGFLHISTDYVFNGESFIPYSELNAVNPVSVYGKTKLEGEERSLHENPETCIVRTSWLYSAYGHNFLKTILKLGRERNEIRVVFDQIGTPTYAADLAEVIVSIMEIYLTRKENFSPGIYHFSNEGVASWYDFAKTIFEIAGIGCRVVPVLSDAFPTAAKRPHYSVLNKSRLKTNYNIEIPYWKESVEICVKKILKQEYDEE